MQTFTTVIHIITCVLITLVVLMQSGKGAEISASLGGSSNTIFGSSGGANFFTKLTFVLAAIFATTSMTLTYLGKSQKKSVFETVSTPKTNAPVENPVDTSTLPAAGMPGGAPSVPKAKSVVKPDGAAAIPAAGMPAPVPTPKH